MKYLKLLIFLLPLFTTTCIDYDSLVPNALQDVECCWASPAQTEDDISGNQYKPCKTQLKSWCLPRRRSVCSAICATQEEYDNWLKGF